MILELKDSACYDDDIKFEYDLIITDYRSGQYDGDGEAIILKNNKIVLLNLGHCSCYGPMDDSIHEAGRNLNNYKWWTEQEFLELPITEFNNAKILEAYHWYKQWNNKIDFYAKFNEFYYKVVETKFGIFGAKIFQLINNNIKHVDKNIFCKYDITIQKFEKYDNLDEIKAEIL